MMSVARSFLLLILSPELPGFCVCLCQAQFLNGQDQVNKLVNNKVQSGGQCERTCEQNVTAWHKKGEESGVRTLTFTALLPAFILCLHLSGC